MGGSLKAKAQVIGVRSAKTHHGEDIILTKKLASNVKTKNYGITGVSTPGKLCGEHLGNKEETVRICRREEIHRSIRIYVIN